MTPLMAAGMGGSLEVADDLLAHGARRTDRDKRQYTAVDYAIKTGYLRLASLLLSDVAPVATQPER
jgi:ankyrin repeat protein